MFHGQTGHGGILHPPGGLRVRRASAAQGAGHYRRARRRRKHGPTADPAGVSAGPVTVLDATVRVDCVVSFIAHTIIPSVSTRVAEGGQEPAL
ncbi:hypothetical protein GCM10022403_048100 [Streptomyces coacervatus]|uniref:Uncharacterized protein n=1 Tax=Streptomyces coacervatus TaxID=647381 RepID=A0ABP7I311_9ACTN